MKGCLCIHGFTGAPYEVEPLAEALRTQTDLDYKYAYTAIFHFLWETREENQEKG